MTRPTQTTVGCAHSWHATCGACPSDQRDLYYSAHPSPADPRYRKPSSLGWHRFVKDPADGWCAHCPLPERNRVHGTPF